MADHGKALGVDLYQLEQVAKSDLPTVASVYDDAVGNAQRAKKSLDGIPNAYGGLHGTAVKILKETSSSLDDTAKSLNEVISAGQRSD